MHVLLLLFDSIKWHTHYLSESKWEKGRLSEFMVVREVGQDAVLNACNVAKLDVSTWDARTHTLMGLGINMKSV